MKSDHLIGQMKLFARQNICIDGGSLGVIF